MTWLNMQIDRVKFSTKLVYFMDFCFFLTMWYKYHINIFVTWNFVFYFLPAELLIWDWHVKKVCLVIRSPQWLTVPLGVAGANHIAQWLRVLFYQWNLISCSGLWIWFFHLLISDRLLTLTITCYQFYTTNETIPPPCYSMLYELCITCLHLYFIPHYL